MSTVGKRINLMRKSLNLTQNQLSSVLNISQGTLSDVEKDNRTLPYEAVISLFEYLEGKPVSFKYIITGNEEPISNSNPIILDGDTGTLTNNETDIILKFRHLDERDQEDIEDSINMKYERTIKKEKSSPYHSA